MQDADTASGRATLGQRLAKVVLALAYVAMVVAALFLLLVVVVLILVNRAAATTGDEHASRAVNDVAANLETWLKRQPFERRDGEVLGRLVSDQWRPRQTPGMADKSIAFDLLRATGLRGSDTFEIVVRIDVTGEFVAGWKGGTKSGHAIACFGYTSPSSHDLRHRRQPCGDEQPLDLSHVVIPRLPTLEELGG